MLDGLGHSHVVDIEGPLKDKLMEIFEAKGGKELLDGVTDLEEKQRTILKFFRDCALAMQLQLRANREHCGKYQDDMKNAHVSGSNNHKVTLPEALNAMLNYSDNSKRKSNPRLNQNGGNNIDDVNLAQTTPIPVRGINGKLHAHVKCNKCHQMGHYSDNCPEDDSEDEIDGVNSCMHAINLCQLTEKLQNISQKLKQVNLLDVVIIDTGSTVHLFGNKNFSTDQRKSNKHLNLSANGGKLKTNDVGDAELDVAWISKHAIANACIHSLLVTSGYRIVSDTEHERAFYIESNRRWMKFEDIGTGLYMCDPNKVDNENNKLSFTDYYNFFETVSDNKLKFSDRYLTRAKEAMELHCKLAKPGVNKFMCDLDNCNTLNCPCTSRDMKVALSTCRKETGTVRGRTLRKKQEVIPRINRVCVPECMLEYYRNIRLFLDIMYINAIPFLHTISEYVKLCTSVFMNNRKEGTFIEKLKAAIDVCETNGFKAENIDADLEFKCVDTQFDAKFNIIDTDSHVHPIERSNRTIKERIRCLIQGLPFRCLPLGMVKALPIFIVRNLNRFPIASRISKSMSPLTLVTAEPKPDFNFLKLEFGEHVEAYKDNKSRINSNDTRGIPAMTLDQEANSIGSYWFLSLITGEKLMRRQWTALPMLDWVTQRIDDMGAADNMPEMNTGYVSFVEPHADSTLPPLPEYSVTIVMMRITQMMMMAKF